MQRHSSEAPPLMYHILSSEMLGQLQESFDSLEQGSRKMLAQVRHHFVIFPDEADKHFQTKNLAAQQTAKRWFGF